MIPRFWQQSCWMATYVKNKIIHTSETPNQETMLKLNILLNGSLNGLALEEINLGTISRLKEQAGIHSAMVSDVLDAVAQAIQEDEDLEIYTSGATNIFKYPELSDSERASELISAFEEKQEFKDLFTADKETEIREPAFRYTSETKARCRE